MPPSPTPISGKLAALSDQVADAAPVVPKPRPKPDSVLMAAAVAAAYDMKIEPASALPPVIIKQNAPLKNAAVVVASADDEQPPVSNLSGKGSLTDDIFGGKKAPAPKTITTASASGSDLFWWPQQATKPAGKNTAAQGLAGILPGGNAEAADVSTMPKLAVATISASGKGDLQVVDRTGKGSLPADATVPIFRRQTVGTLESN
ncbi:hypothetical protein [Aestuariivirga sp.]|uniref:hypothetical protein n=1 Tax=Aestuariivirga sp. TaxID=2650926 RepID=UPI0039E7185B